MADSFELIVDTLIEEGNDELVTTVAVTNQQSGIECQAANARVYSRIKTVLGIDANSGCKSV